VTTVTELLEKREEMVETTSMSTHPVREKEGSGGHHGDVSGSWSCVQIDG
jgi:hypothetical protein